MSLCLSSCTSLVYTGEVLVHKSIYEGISKVPKLNIVTKSNNYIIEVSNPKCHSITAFWVTVHSFAISYLLMADLKEQCICIQFCFILWKCALGTRGTPKTASSDNPVQRTWTFEWFSWFKHAETSIESCDHWGIPSPGHTGENAVKVCKTINKDQWSTILQCLRGASLPDISWMVVEPGLLCQCSNFWQLLSPTLLSHLIWLLF
jgi:hypothetical protein